MTRLQCGKVLLSFCFQASLRVAASDWSDKFSLDTVGSSGDVQCKTKTKQIYTVGVKITLSSGGLTKICTFSPFYMLLNTSEVYTLNFFLRQTFFNHEQKINSRASLKLIIYFVISLLAVLAFLTSPPSRKSLPYIHITLLLYIENIRDSRFHFRLHM